MRADQVAQRFDVVFDGRGYLCVHDYVRPVQTLVDVTPVRRNPSENVSDRIRAALPGTRPEIMERSGCTGGTVDWWLSKWNVAGQIVKTKNAERRIVYALVTS